MTMQSRLMAGGSALGVGALLHQLGIALGMCKRLEQRHRRRAHLSRHKRFSLAARC